MGNSLLDFVMALVRDPQVAARYAADPAGALSAAGLPGVTITDVQNLIPVVTDSLAAATPSFGGAVDAASVWTSGAAAAALDAFHLPHQVPVVDVASPQLDVPAIDLPFDPGPSPNLGAPALDPVPAIDAGAGPLDQPYLDPAGAEWADAESGVPAGWDHAHDLPSEHPPADHSGFDLF